MRAVRNPKSILNTARASWTLTVAQLVLIPRIEVYNQAKRDDWACARSVKETAPLFAQAGYGILLLTSGTSN